MATITSLGFSIHSTYDGSGVSAARRDIEGLDASLTRSSGQLDIAARGFSGLTSAAVALSPALAPIGAALTAVAGGLTAMGTTAGTALGVYGAAMKGAISSTLEMAKAGKELTPVQTAFVGSVDKMKTAWQNFITATQDKTLTTATTVVEGITAAIGKLKPVVDAVHPLIKKLADEFKNWAAGDGFDRFIDSVVQYGVPALKDLVAAGKDITSVLGSAFRSLLPLVPPISDAIKRGAEELKKWADGGGFERFLSEVQKNAPQVKEFFSTLWDAVKNLAQVFKELGPLALGLATALLKIIAALPPSTIENLAKAFLALKLAMLASNVVMAITLALGISISAPFILIGAVIAALIIVVYLLVTRWKEFSTYISSSFMDAVRTVWEFLKQLGEWISGFFAKVWDGVKTAWNTVWNALKTAGEAVWNGIKTAWQAVCNTFSTVWQSVSGALTAAWNAVWNALKAAGEAVWNGIKAAWQAVVNTFTAVWQTVSGALTTAWNAVWNALKTAGEAVWNAIKTAWQAVCSTFSTVWQTVSGALTTAWNTVWNALKTAGEAVWNAIKTAWQAVCSTFSTVWQTVSAALKTAWDTVWNGLKTAAQAVWDWMKNTWKTIVDGLKTAWDAVSGALKSAWDTVWNGIKDVAQNVWDWIKQKWEEILNSLKSAWDNLGNALKSAWETVWNGIKDLAQKVWDWIKQKWEETLNSLKSAWDNLGNALKSAWETVWNGIKDLAQKVWDWIKQKWEEIVNGFKEIWDRISGLLKQAWDSFWDGLKSKVEDIWKGIGETVQKGVDSLKDKLKDLPGGNVVGGILGATGLVPGMANGGVVGMASGGVVQSFASGGLADAGGVLGGYSPGNDTVATMLSPGEGVLVPEAVRGLGSDFVYWANKHFSNGRVKGYANGGVVSSSSGRVLARGTSSVSDDGQIIQFAEGAFQFNFNAGVTQEALHRIEDDLVPKLRMAVQAGVGRRA